MLDQCPDGWIDFYTSDCEATHCILTDGCVGFYTETSVPDFGVNGKARIVFDSMEIPFVLRIEADGVDPFDMDVKQTGKIVIALPESFVPGTEIRIRIGMSPRMGSDQLSIRRNVYWRMDNK